ncbi:MAG: tetratricopeptide repeat protein [Candidatus Omnitrophota bacterium]
MPNSKMRLFFFALILILSCTFLAYFNTLNNPFIWDDDALILKNPLIKDANLLVRAFSSDLYYGVSSGSNFYRPIQTVSYMWDYYFWQLDPKGYHITNILLQGIVSFLVFLLLYLIFKRPAISLAASLLFAVSPIHTEAVSYISGRADMLMAIFLLSSLLLFIKFENAKFKATFLTLSLFSFGLGLLSKELSVVFPLAILAYLYYFKRARIASSLPFFLISGLYVYLRLFFFKFSTLRPPSLVKFPFLIRLTVQPKVIFSYLKLLFLPVDLHMSRELVRPVSFFGIFASWFILGMIFVSCVHFLKYKDKMKAASFFLSWFLIFLLPQSGIFPINAFVSEHFVYLSSLSFFVAFSYLLFKALKKKIFILSIPLILVLYGLLTHTRNIEWGNPQVFFERIIKFSPDSFQALNNLGLEYEKCGLFDKAIDSYKKALKIMPDLLEAHSNLANLYFKLARFDDAQKEYLIVEKTAPGSKAGEIQNNMGALYEMQGKLDQAKARYSRALSLDPSLKFSHFNIARIYLIKGNADLAGSEILYSLSGDLRKGTPVLRIVSDFLKEQKNISCSPAFYNDLGVKFAQARLFDESILSFSRSLDLSPSYADAHFNLGLAYLNKGLKRQASLEFKAALKIDPAHERSKALLSEIRKNTLKK